MSRPIHFEIEAFDVRKALDFYAAAFGWTYEDYSEYAQRPYFGVITGPEDSPGINGAIMEREKDSAPPSPENSSNGAVLTMGVVSFDITARKIAAAGGKVVVEKYALPGMAWQGYFRDTDGNVFGIHEPDENAVYPSYLK
ncbi:VOC family protein [Corynebacterium sp. L4756]|uniref:VOC family protein n=1 Tax=unclassified Corynebacterium TaxID=2624378 RepID=UPI00374D73A8